MIKWKKRNAVYTTYLSADGEWQIRRQGAKRGSMWSLYRAKRDGDIYEHVGSYPTLNDAQQTAVYKRTVDEMIDEVIG